MNEPLQYTQCHWVGVTSSKISAVQKTAFRGKTKFCQAEDEAPSRGEGSHKTPAVKEVTAVVTMEGSRILLLRRKNVQLFFFVIESRNKHFEQQILTGSPCVSWTI